MSDKYVIGELRHAVKALTESGEEVVTVGQLNNALDMLEGSLSVANGERLQGATEFDNNMHLEKYRATQVSEIEVYKTVNENGRIALRSLFLMNGGAAIAMAAFIGNSSGKKPINALDLPSLSAALLMFAIGVLLASIAHGTNYVCTYLYSERDKQSIVKWGHRVNVLTVLLGLCGYIAFVLGLYKSTQSFLL